MIYTHRVNLRPLKEFNSNYSFSSLLFCIFVRFYLLEDWNLIRQEITTLKMNTNSINYFCIDLNIISLLMFKSDQFNITLNESINSRNTFNSRKAFSKQYTECETFKLTKSGLNRLLRVKSE